MKSGGSPEGGATSVDQLKSSVLFVAFPEVDNRISYTNTLKGQEPFQKPVASNAVASNARAETPFGEAPRRRSLGPLGHTHT